MSGYSLERVAALEEAIGSGVLKVRFKDHETTYRSLDEMKESLRLAKEGLGLVSSSRRTVAVSSPGF